MFTQEASRRVRPCARVTSLAPIAVLAGSLVNIAPARATTLPLTDFPQAIQAEVAAGATLNTSTSLDSNGRSAFPYLTTDDTVEWLLRYPLFPASRQVASSDDGFGNWTTLTTPLTGWIWLEAPATLPASPGGPTPYPVPFTLYTDFVTPAPNNIWILGNGRDLPLTAGLTDVVTQGGASRVWGLDWDDLEYSYGSLHTVGDSSGEGLVPCAAAGCEVSTDLNLVGLDYTLSGFPFDAADPRALLYRQNSQYLDTGGWDVTQYYYVASVPEPASAFLVTVAILGIGWWRPRVG